VTLLEAESRLGGRIHTTSVSQQTGESHGNASDGDLVELGAQWLHGTKKNPLYDIAAKEQLLRAPPRPPEDRGKRKRSSTWLKSTGEACNESEVARIRKLLGAYARLMEKAADGTLQYERSDSLAPATVGQYLEDRYDNSISLTEGRTPLFEQLDRATWAWRHKLQCAIDGCAHVTDLDLERFCSYEELEGPNMRIGMGFQDICFHLAKGLDIRYDSAVARIDWSELVVKLECANGEAYEADHVVVTASVGVLKAQHATMFEPPLPGDKVEAIETLGFGVVDKIFVAEVGDVSPLHQHHTLNFLWIDEAHESAGSRTGDTKETSARPWTQHIFELSYDRPSGTRLGWVSGSAAMEMEACSNDEIREHISGLYRHFGLHSDGIKQVFGTRWGTNPHFRGSYSYIKASTCQAPNEKLARSLGPVSPDSTTMNLHFAGEACSTKHYSTAHGAYMSGIEAGLRIHEQHR